MINGSDRAIASLTQMTSHQLSHDITFHTVVIVATRLHDEVTYLSSSRIENMPV